MGEGSGIRGTAKKTDKRKELCDLKRLKASFTLWGKKEEWLKRNSDKIIRAQEIAPRAGATARPADRRTAAEVEEYVLRCLGASVLMQWSTNPTKLQRELFGTAGSLGDVMQTAAVRSQVARFLHRQKDAFAQA